MEICKDLSESLAAVKKKSPLIHHLTNYVTVNDCANIVLAIGASPVMAEMSKGSGRFIGENLCNIS